MALHIRELTIRDEAVYAEFLSNHKNTWTHDQPVKDPAMRSHKILSSSRILVLGAMSEATADGEAEAPLMMTISAWRWTSMPYYTLIDFKSRETMGLRAFKNYFGPLVQTLVLSMEAERRFEFWYLIEDKDVYVSRAQRQGRNIMQYVVPHLKTYSIFDEARFPAGEVPEWPVYASMLGDRPAKVPTVLRRAMHHSKLTGR